MDAACTGTCKPYSLRCQGDTVQMCSSAGEYHDSMTCSNPHGQTACDAGLCHPVCSAGFGDCDGNSANGCEADLSSPASCGMCGNACAGGQSCTAGTCECPPGRTLCGNACVDPDTDEANCGGCGKACAGGQSCTAGTCECPPGQTLCGNACVDLDTDQANCGECGKACRAPHMVAACSGGVCMLGPCDTGYLDCNASLTDGCEVHAEVAPAQRQTCVLKSDGTLWCWGDNTRGALGNGSTTSSDVPVQVPGLTNAAAVRGSVGGFYCVRLINDQVWCWGEDAHGELGDGQSGYQTTPVLAGVTPHEITTGTSHACEIDDLFQTWCWGDNRHGAVGDATALVTGLPPTQVAGTSTSLYGVAAGDSFSCGLRRDGGVDCWGEADYGSLGSGTTASECGGTCVTSPRPVTGLADAIELHAGGRVACARRSDGSLWCWGDNRSGELGLGTSGGSDCAGGCEATPQQLTTLGTGVAGFASGNQFACATLNDGTLWCWGKNDSGQLGDGTEQDQPAPVQVEALGNDVGFVAAGASHACAVKTNGTLWCWGLNNSGQVGTGATGGSGCSGNCVDTPADTGIDLCARGPERSPGSAEGASAPGG